ncbi:MAG: SpoVR family protein [Gammaproteobacteria bacterium]|jgi:spore cortex formation protein SpoVR/YcgB (stage V sporulation)|nr:SpoVR family protein [Gammaproteobacteria bacterium]
MKTRSNLLPQSSEWTFESLSLYEKAIGDIANQFHLDTYPNQIEVISAEQMIDLYASTGLPIHYPHWSFGKQFVNTEKLYLKGYTNLSYEMVINSDPCISYLLEENSMILQATVIAHACYGHNSFFKNNYLFKTWANADSIIDYMVFAKNYIHECEQKYGTNAVEELLDACHALKNYGIDRYKRPQKISLQEEKLRQTERASYLQSQVNDLWRTIPEHFQKKQGLKHKKNRFPAEPEENLLYFLEKNAPLLEPWQREIIRISRKIAQYFYPQKLTKVMNEGWATFWHYTIINELYNQKMISDAFMIEFLKNHTNLIYQFSYDDPHYFGLNPYTLGYSLFTDIYRMCTLPTDEDNTFFPELTRQNPLEALDFAMRNFKDESFILQYLSPKVMRDLKLFAILDDEKQPTIKVTAIHDSAGYEDLRQVLSQQYNLASIEPNIQIYEVNVKGDRSVTLRHIQTDHRPLDEESTTQVLKHFHSLWGFDVILESVSPEGTVLKIFRCPTIEPPVI